MIILPSGNDYIVSMALIKARENNLGRIIKNINQQTLKPKKIYVFLSKEAFYLDQGFDHRIPKTNIPNVKIKVVENIGALRKFLPILKEYWDRPKTKILLTDDDHIWNTNTFKILIENARKLNGVVSTAGNHYRDTRPGNWRKTWFHGTSINQPTKCHIISTGYGCVIRPMHFTEEIFEWEKYKSLGLPYDDEFWFNYMLAKNNIIRWVVPVPERRKKLNKGGVDMFKTPESRKTKAVITQKYKDIIMRKL